MTDIPLILFAKAPIIGKVKTRLHPHCGAQHATQIAKILLEQTCRVTSENWPGRVLLSVSLNLDDPFIVLMQQRYKVKVVAQSEGDLGQKMNNALNEHGYPAAVMGCDVPHCPPETLKQVYRLIQSGENVIGASEDGGYYFLGLQRPSPSLFTDIQWGEDQVYADTMRQALLNKLVFENLAMMFDIDRWQDVLRAANSLPELASYLSEHDL